jgi:Sigma-70 factor, region 1.1
VKGNRFIPHYVGAHFLEMHMDRDRLVVQIVQQASQAAKRSGKVTFDQLNALMPADQFAPEQIEQVLSGLAEKDIRVVDE